MTPDDPRHQHPDDPASGAAPSSTDDLASALLDGLLSADDAAAARRRPDVMARAAAMDAARSAMRAVPSPSPAADPGARERAVAAALAAFDDPVAGSGPPATADADAARRDLPGDHGAVPDLATHRRQRSPVPASAARRGSPRWLGAAAAVAAAVVGVAGLIAVSSDDGSQDSASDAPNALDEDASTGSGNAEAAPESGDSGDSGDDSASDGAEAPSAEAEAGSGLDATPEVGDLGTFPSDDALADRVASMLADRDDGVGVAPNASLPPGADAQRPNPLCSADLAGLPAPLSDPATALRLHGRAVVDGQEVEVWAVDTPGGPRIVALDSACTVVVDRPLR
jgi:hypothetical protein